MREIVMASALAIMIPLAAQPLPPGGTPLVGLTDFATQAGFRAGDNEGRPIAQRTVIEVSDRTFHQAARIQVQHPDGQFWNAAMSAPAKRAVLAGDVVLIHFFMRAVETSDETGGASCQVYAEGPAPQYEKSLCLEARAGREWQEFYLPFAILKDYADGTFSFHFGFGGGERPQVFDIGGVEVIHYGKTILITALPRTRFEYEGRAPDAPWRAEAAAHIEQCRKGPFTVTVLDAAGQPAAGVKVHVCMKRHAYKFGSVVSAARIMDRKSDDARIYREKVLELFNASGPENDLKWPPWDGDWGERYSRTQTLAAYTWLKEQGFYLRGHVLVWPHSRNLPKRIQPLLAANDPAVPQMVLDHIADIVAATAPILDEWDVVNEPYNNHDLMDVYGRDIMVDWFHAARRHNPTATLYINDFGILSAGGRDTAHQRHYEETIRFLVERGAPLGGIGMQGHFDATPTDIPRVLQILDRFAAAFPTQVIKVTEFDVDTDDEALQADYTRDFMTAIFSHPRTVGFQMWGFWEGAHWRSRAAMYTHDWQEKPNAKAYRDLVLKEWWTDVSGVTGTDGTFSGRGFFGDYEVEAGGKATPFALSPGHGAVEVIMAPRS